MKEKVTKRKFYGKWLYKVSLNLKGAAAFRIHSIEQITAICNGDQPIRDTGYPYSLTHDIWKNQVNINKVVQFAWKWPKKEWSQRIEGDIFDIYTNNKKLFKDAREEFKDLIREISSPSPTSLDVLDDPRSVVVKKYPHNIYQYKVFLQPHKLSKDETEKQKYIDWINSQKGIKITPAVEKWFIETSWNWDRRYILVENDSVLLMLNLKNPQVLGTVHKYVLSDK